MVQWLVTSKWECSEIGSKSKNIFKFCINAQSSTYTINVKILSEWTPRWIEGFFYISYKEACEAWAQESSQSHAFDQEKVSWRFDSNTWNTSTMLDCWREIMADVKVICFVSEFHPRAFSLILPKQHPDAYVIYGKALYHRKLWGKAQGRKEHE